MINDILDKGVYFFKGTLKDFERCVSSFKKTKEIKIGECLGVQMCELYGKFKYHGEFHTVHIEKLWDSEVLKITLIGGPNERTNEKR